jgi:hypothetical protein
MDETFTIQQLLAARKLTRDIGEALRARVIDYLATLTPVFRPRAILGDYIQGSGKEPVRGADQAFKELQTLYESIATKWPFNLPSDVASPLMHMTSAIELSPVEYAHTVSAATGGAKTISVTSPLKWIVSYATYSPKRLRELLANPNRSEAELRQFVLHYLAMHVVVSKRPGLPRILETLQFPLSSVRLAGLGDLPVTQVASVVSTRLPPDGMVLESTDLSGKDAFEEIVNVDDIATLRNPLQEQLKALASGVGSRPA